MAPNKGHTMDTRGGMRGLRKAKLHGLCEIFFHANTYTEDSLCTTR